MPFAHRRPPIAWFNHHSVPKARIARGGDTPFGPCARLPHGAAPETSPNPRRRAVCKGRAGTWSSPRRDGRFESRNLVRSAITAPKESVTDMPVMIGNTVPDPECRTGRSLPRVFFANFSGGLAFSRRTGIVRLAVGVGTRGSDAFVRRPTSLFRSMQMSWWIWAVAGLLAWLFLSGGLTAA